MKNNHLITVMIAGAAAVLLGTGCKKKKTEQPVPIYQRYQVHYYPELNVTWADANFYYSDHDGPVVKFANQHSVKANGEITIYQTGAVDGTFGWRLAGTPDVVFTFTRNDGSTLTNKVTVPQPGYLGLEVDSVLHISDTMRLRWTGSPLQSGEWVNVALNRISYDSTNSPGYVTADIIDDSHEVTLDYTQTSQFAPGTYQLRLLKVGSKDLQQPDGTAGGIMMVGVIIEKEVKVK